MMKHCCISRSQSVAFIWKNLTITYIHRAPNKIDKDKKRKREREMDNKSLPPKTKNDYKFFLRSSIFIALSLFLVTRTTILIAFLSLSNSNAISSFECYQYSRHTHNLKSEIKRLLK